MSRFIESIKVEQRQAHNLEYHNERLNNTRKEVLGCHNFIDLQKEIIIPENIGNGLYKCRIVYSQKVETIEFIPYQKKQIESLKIIEANDLDYTYKYENREALNTLFNQRRNCDDILIVQNGLVTDTSYCNIAFYDGVNWLTPSSPLLRGTMRTSLLKSQKILAATIHISDLHSFTQARVFNALLGWEEENEVNIRSMKQ